MGVTLVQTIIIGHCNYCNRFLSDSSLVSLQVKMLSQTMFFPCSVPSTGSSSHSEQNPNLLSASQNKLAALHWPLVFPLSPWCSSHTDLLLSPPRSWTYSHLCRHLSSVSSYFWRAVPLHSCGFLSKKSSCIILHKIALNFFPTSASIWFIVPFKKQILYQLSSQGTHNRREHKSFLFLSRWPVKLTEPHVYFKLNSLLPNGIF